jgi:hypothetical protein
MATERREMPSFEKSITRLIPKVTLSDARHLVAPTPH